MMLVSFLLITLALVDGACSGFRSSLGRTGLIRHRDADVKAAAVGATVVAVLLVPAAVLALWQHAQSVDASQHYRNAAIAMLWVLGPYAAATLVALTAYGVLGWREKYLAIALILGPFTLIRPLVAVAGGAAAALAAKDRWTVTVIALSVIAVLAVEPLMDRQAQHRGSPEAP